MRDRLFHRASSAANSSAGGDSKVPAGETASSQPLASDAQPANDSTPNSASPKGSGVLPPMQSNRRRPVAVIGFKNLSGAGENAWVSTALGEALTSDLSAGGKILAIPTDTIAQMKTSLAISDSDTDTRDKLAKIGGNLGA